MKVQESKSSKTFAKAAEIGISAVLLPLVLRDLTPLSIPIANSLGIFIALIIVYWIPPIFRNGFVRWIIISLLIAVCVFIFSKAVAESKEVGFISKWQNYCSSCKIRRVDYFRHICESVVEHEGKHCESQLPPALHQQTFR